MILKYLLLLMALSACSSKKESGEDKSSSGEKKIDAYHVELSKACTPAINGTQSMHSVPVITCNLNKEEVHVGAIISVNGKKCENLIPIGIKKFSCELPLNKIGAYDIHITNPDTSHYVIKNGVAYNNCNQDFTLDPPIGYEVEYNETINLSGSCGIPPYRYEIIKGSGSLDKKSNIFIASNYEDVTKIIQQDAVGFKKELIISTIPHPLSLGISSLYLTAGQSHKFNATGGTPPYSYIMNTGLGTISSDGLLQLSNLNISEKFILYVKDSKNRTAMVTITTSKINFMPATATISITNEQQYIIAGGTPPYQFILTGINGTMDGNKVFHPLSSGSGSIKIKDANGVIVESTLIVNPKLTAETNRVIYVGDVLNIAATGGVLPYTYALKSTSVGGVDSKGKFSSNSPGNALVEISDKLGNKFEVSIQVKSALQLNYSNQMASIGSQQINVIGGKAPYVFSIVSGPGEITSQGNYTSSWTIDPTTIKVVDNTGSEKNFIIEKLPTTLVANYNFDSIQSALPDIDNNLVLNRELAQSEYHLVVNKMGQVISYHNEIDEDFTYSNFSYPNPPSCTNGPFWRDISSIENDGKNYFLQERVCFSPKEIRIIKNKELLDEAIFSESLPTQWGSEAITYKAITMDKEGSIYIIGVIHLKTLIWKFSPSNNQQ